MSTLGTVGAAVFLWLMFSGLFALAFAGESRLSDYERTPLPGQLILILCWPILLVLFVVGWPILYVLASLLGSLVDKGP